MWQRVLVNTVGYNLRKNTLETVCYYFLKVSIYVLNNHLYVHCRPQCLCKQQFIISVCLRPLLCRVNSRQVEFRRMRLRNAWGWMGRVERGWKGEHRFRLNTRATPITKNKRRVLGIRALALLALLNLGSLTFKSQPVMFDSIIFQVWSINTYIVTQSEKLLNHKQK